MLVQSTPLRTSSEMTRPGVLFRRQLLRRLQDVLVDVERGAHASDANASDAVMQVIQRGQCTRRRQELSHQFAYCSIASGSESCEQRKEMCCVLSMERRWHFLSS